MCVCQRGRCSVKNMVNGVTADALTLLHFIFSVQVIAKGIQRDRNTHSLQLDNRQHKTGNRKEHSFFLYIFIVFRAFVDSFYKTMP